MKGDPFAGTSDAEKEGSLANEYRPALAGCKPFQRLGDSIVPRHFALPQWQANCFFSVGV